MNMKKKIIAISLCAALAATAVIGGTLAYFTDTATVTNSFTVGNVTITLDEAPVDANGQEIAGERVTGNTYKLIPGKTYDKDPTIHVQANSESCYLFVEVNNTLADLEANADSDTIAEQMTDNGWTFLKDNIYYYNSIVNSSENAQNFVVFENFKIAGEKTAEELKDINPVTINAYAVQSEGFDTASDAWEATFGK